MVEKGVIKVEVKELKVIIIEVKPDIVKFVALQVLNMLRDDILVGGYFIKGTNNLRLSATPESYRLNNIPDFINLWSDNIIKETTETLVQIEMYGDLKDSVRDELIKVPNTKEEPGYIQIRYEE